MSRETKRKLAGGAGLVAVAAMLVAVWIATPLWSNEGPEIREIVLEAKILAFGGDNPTVDLIPGERVRFVVRNNDPGILHSITIPGVDSTVFEHDNRWWLICTNAGDGRDDKLLVWHADSLFGPWQPHALNPVKIDIRSARPAGTPFMHDGHLYRPAQDCSATYGGRIVINRVTRLTPTAFEEEAYRTIDPVADGQYNRGLHTLSRLGQTQTLVDGKRYRFHLAGLIYGLRFIARKLCGTAAAGAD